MGFNSGFKGLKVKKVLRNPYALCECAPKILNQATSFTEFGMDVMPLFGPGSLNNNKTLKIMHVKAIFFLGGGNIK